MRKAHEHIELVRREMTVLGWREYVGLPDWGIRRLLCKVDTGARTSALDVVTLEELADNRVRFEVGLSRKRRDKTVAIEAPIVRRTVVRPSSGQRHERLVVATQIKLGAITQRVELTLVCRKAMLCRMLLGRRALAGRFLVDVGHRHLLRSKSQCIKPKQ